MSFDEFYKRLLAGCTVSVVTRTLTAPLERVKLDLQLNSKKLKAQDVISSVWRLEGPRGFLKGLGRFRHYQMKLTQFYFVHSATAVATKSLNISSTGLGVA